MPKSGPSQHITASDACWLAFGSFPRYLCHERSSDALEMQCAYSLGVISAYSLGVIRGYGYRSRLAWPFTTVAV